MNLVAIDFETANECRNSACALGVAVIADGCVTNTYSWLIRPPVLYFNPTNVSIHGITAEDVGGRPSFGEAWPDISRVILGPPLIAHNASFDFSVLRSLFDAYSIDCPLIEYYCTCQLARRVWPKLANHRLTTVAEHLGIQFRHHDPAADATTCAEIAIRACESLRAENITAAVAAVGLKAKKLSAGSTVTRRAPCDSIPSVHSFATNGQRGGSSIAEIGEVTCTYTSKGIAKYSITVGHPGLMRFQDIKSDDPYVLLQKAQAKADQWDDAWRRQQQAANQRTERNNRAAEIEQKVTSAMAQTDRAQAELDSLGNILAHTLVIDDTIDWESLKCNANYPKPKPSKPTLPAPPEKPEFRAKPKSTDPQYMPGRGVLDILFASRRRKKIDVLAKRFAADCQIWENNKKEAIDRYNHQVLEYNSSLLQLQEQFTGDVESWSAARAKYFEDQARANAAVDRRKSAYLSGAPGAVLDYCDMVLTRSQYPDYFPQSYELDYRPENTLVVVNYRLPAPKDLPTLKEVKYVRSRDEYAEKHISTSERNRLYDSVLYQVALRTIHELFEADQVSAFESIVFNGYVSSVDPATGKDTNSCVLSLQAERAEFLEIDLAKVDPKACFRKLKGVGSSKLHSITPVAPIVILDKEDSRFIQPIDVGQTLDDSTNLASMDWEEFEHLIRQIFENHFAAGGGEVKVTHASRDGGVDAVAFDPDPIRGGKIVIQAKRYTNTVGVGAVRDLYGTLINEGANKGILVTTSHYGPDAYGFAKGKPITLLDGSNLLHLLQSYGYKARIDINEARARLLGSWLDRMEPLDKGVEEAL